MINKTTFIDLRKFLKFLVIFYITSAFFVFLFPPFRPPDMAYYVKKLIPHNIETSVMLMFFTIISLLFYGVYIAGSHQVVSLDFWTVVLLHPILLRLIYWEPDDFPRNLIGFVYLLFMSFVAKTTQNKQAVGVKIAHMFVLSTIALNLLFYVFYPPFMGLKTNFIEYQVNYLVPFIYFFPIIALMATTIAEDIIDRDTRALSIIYLTVFIVLLRTLKVAQFLYPYWLGSLTLYYLSVRKTNHLRFPTIAGLLLFLLTYIVIANLYTNYKYYTLATPYNCVRFEPLPCSEVGDFQNISHYCYYKFGSKFRCSLGGEYT